MGGGYQEGFGVSGGGGGFGGGSQLTCRKDRAHSRALRCRIARCCFSSPPMGQLSLKHSASGQPCGPPPTPPPLPGSATVSPATAPMGGTRGRHPKGHGRMGTWGWGHSPGCWGGREDQPPPSCRGAAARGCAGSAPMGRVGDSAVCHLPPPRVPAPHPPGDTAVPSHDAPRSPLPPHVPRVTQCHPVSPNVPSTRLSSSPSVPTVAQCPQCHPEPPSAHLSLLPTATQCHPVSPLPIFHCSPLSPSVPSATLCPSVTATQCPQCPQCLQCHPVPISHCSLLSPSVTQCPQ